MSGLDLKWGEVSGVAWISLDGSLDTLTSEKLEQLLFQLMKRGIVKIVVNFEKLQYISSSGIGVLVGNCNEIREKGGDLKFAALPTRIKRAFQMVSLLDLFEVYDSLGDAISSFK